MRMRGQQIQHRMLSSSNVQINSVQAVPLGMMCLGFGIAWLTINERRDVRQVKFREFAEEVCVTVDSSKTRIDPLLDQSVVHNYIHSQTSLPTSHLRKIQSSTCNTTRRCA